MAPLPVVRVYLASDQISYLKIKAARRHLSLSALLREIVEQDRRRERDADRRRAREDPEG